MGKHPYRENKKRSVQGQEEHERCSDASKNAGHGAVARQATAVLQPPTELQSHSGDGFRESASEVSGAVDREGPLWRVGDFVSTCSIDIYT